MRPFSFATSWAITAGSHCAERTEAPDLARGGVLEAPPVRGTWLRDSRPLYNRVELERIRWTCRRRGASSEDWPRPRGRSQTPCQGEGRGFESRLSLSKRRLL